MQGRYFIVAFKSDMFKKKDAFDIINNVFKELKYTKIQYAAQQTNPPAAQQKIIFEKGNKFATYMGLVNGDLVYRRVEFEIVDDKGEAHFSYYFSWLTNIGILLSRFMPELRLLKNKFGAKTVKIVKFS
jgi:hypothetical protein